MSDRPLKSQVALVTGAGKRLGRATALALGGAGASVVVNYLQSRGAAEATAKEIRELGVDAIAVRADVSQPRQVQAMFRAVEKRFGRLDILVNNAAVFFARPWAEITEADWDRALGINLKGTFFCAQAAARLMMKRKAGRIINLSSLGGVQAWPSYMPYCTSKAGVIMLTRCLAKALAPHIQVNSVAPGTILVGDEQPSPTLARAIRSTPLQRAGRPEDVAQMVLFLATRADYVTGQVFLVDGGKSIP
jgi:NAD(P)-dependent dehydrogenase (short-subunit alcohol dehydrogenase family)